MGSYSKSSINSYIQSATSTIGMYTGSTGLGWYNGTIGYSTRMDFEAVEKELKKISKKKKLKLLI